MKKNSYSYLDQLNTRELEQLLRDGALTEEGDPARDLYILELLEQRELEDPVQCDAERMLREFHTLYNTVEGEGCSLYACDVPEIPQGAKHKPFSLRKTLLAAVIAVCLIVLLVCTVVGLENIFQMIGIWTPDKLTFENQYDGEVPKMETTPTKPEEEITCTSLQEAISAYGITAPVVPTYIPDGLGTPIVDVSDNEGFMTRFTAFYNGGGGRLMILITAWDGDDSSTFEKDDSEVVEYVRGGITHYLYNNLNSTCAAWRIGNLECMIDTDLSREEVIAMVDSIYE